MSYLRAIFIVSNPFIFVYTWVTESFAAALVTLIMLIVGECLIMFWVWGITGYIGKYIVAFRKLFPKQTTIAHH